MVAGVGSDGSARPSWIDELLAEIRPHATAAADRYRQLREWIGLAIAAILTYLLAAGISSIESIQTQVDRTETVSIATKEALDRHVRSANEANMALAAILRTIEGRTARLEGIEEGRQRGDQR